jgi:hypothetical protein
MVYFNIMRNSCTICSEASNHFRSLVSDADQISICQRPQCYPQTPSHHLPSVRAEHRYKADNIRVHNNLLISLLPAAPLISKWRNASLKLAGTQLVKHNTCYRMIED